MNETGWSGEAVVKLTAGGSETTGRYEETKTVRLDGSLIVSEPILFGFTAETAGQVEIEVSVHGGSTLLTGNSTSVEVFAPCPWSDSTDPVVVLATDSVVARFLGERGVRVVKEADLSRRNTWIVPRLDGDWLQSLPVSRLEEIRRRVEAGDRLLVLETGDISGSKIASLLPGFTPERLERRKSEGHFVGVFHWIRKHPLFSGLPAGGLAHQVYQNIAPAGSFTHADPSTAVAGCFQSFDKSNHQWWAADLLVTRIGKGAAILSQFQISENLGSDPAADRFLFNCLHAEL